MDFFKGLLGGILPGMFGGDDYKNPAQSADPYLRQIPDILKQYMNPYVEAGAATLPQLQRQYGQMISDPNAIIKRLGQGYQASPQYQWELGQGQQAINNAQAAGGMAGSQQHQQMAGSLATNLANRDFQQYLQNAMGMYGSGVSGLQGLGKMGATSGMGLAEALAQVLGTQAQYGYAGTAGQNQYNAQQQSNLLGGLGTLASLAGLFM